VLIQLAQSGTAVELAQLQQPTGPQTDTANAN
jgi:hypothetical protein